ncbi:MAG: hypothetical protein KJ646_01305 [Nanoarchaeota archaeon]|nr:hypothetical protein [Nanoarchaeota archaeon]
MAYKRYIKKNGRIYGPYTYHSKKENGKVISTYLGKSKPKKNYNQIIFLGAIFLFIFLSLLFVVKLGLTGRVSLSIEDSYEFGEQILGSVKLNLKQGELVPLSTKILVDNAGEIKEFLLSDLISYDISEGNFYVENVEISGAGKGYGVLGEKIIYPDVSFVLNVLPKGLVAKPEKTGEPEQESVEEPEIIPENITEEIIEANETEEVTEEEIQELEEVVEELEEQEQEESEEEVVEQEVVEQEENEVEPEKESKEKEEKVKEEKDTTGVPREQGMLYKGQEPAPEEPEPEESAPEPEPAEPSPLTGEVVSEQILEVEGVVSKDKGFSYELPQGKSAEIKSSSQEIELLIIDDTAVVTTEYSETEQGFGEDYLIEEISEILIDLNQLNLTAFQEGDLIISLIYDGVEIVSVSETINIEGKELEIEPEIPVEQNITELNITEIIENQTIINETVIITNITQAEMNLTTIQYGAVLNKPVKWKKNIKLTQPVENLSIEVPIQAENISVYIISSLEEEVEEQVEELETEIIINETTEQEEIVEQEIIPENKTETINETEEIIDTTGVPREQGTLYKGQEETFVINESSQSMSNSEEQINKPDKLKQKIKITAEVISGDVSAEIDLKEKSIFSDFFKKVFSFMTGRVIDVEETKETKEVTIDLDTLSGHENLSRGATEFEIEYETPAPYAIEQNILNGKRITIASEVYYENILAYTLVEDSVSIDSSDLKLYWYASYEDALDYNSALVQNIIEEPIIVNESEEQNITTEINESYSSILTGNVIENETLENIIEIINESVEEIINETSEQEIINETSIPDIKNYSDKIKIQVPYTAYDLDNDGYVDYIEWLVPHLSNQTYELIIEITKAEHLDENRSFISDIYDYVKAQDGNWSEVINDSEYVRVTFEQELDSTRDITVYARSACAVSGDGYVVINGTQVPCDIYQKKKRIEEIRRLLDG